MVIIDLTNKTHFIGIDKVPMTTSERAHLESCVQKIHDRFGRSGDPVDLTVHVKAASKTGKQHEYTVTMRLHRGPSLIGERQSQGWELMNTCDDVTKKCSSLAFD